VIYPPHVEPVNQVFSFVSAEEVALARKIVQEFEAAEARGSAAIQVDGKFVDYPIYRRALRQVRLSQSYQPRKVAH
jgi:citrate lyase subunit beta/citryl-CoA lyase